MVFDGLCLWVLYDCLGLGWVVVSGFYRLVGGLWTNDGVCFRCFFCVVNCGWIALTLVWWVRGTFVFVVLFVSRLAW